VTRSVPASERLRQRIRREKSARPAYGPYLDFWEKILLLQEDCLHQLEISASGTNPPPQAGGLSGVTKDPVLIRALFQKVLQSFAPDNSGPTTEGSRILTWLNSPEDPFKAWIEPFSFESRSFLSHRAAVPGLDAGMMAFLFLACWKPFLKARARVLAKNGTLESLPSEDGVCPVCGSLPALTLLTTEGKREGLCPVCDTRWPLPRLACVHCRKTDPGKLSYFSAETDEGLRLEVCRACGHYWKTIDLRRKRIDPIPELEDLLTTSLDLWAQEKGYRRSDDGQNLGAAFLGGE
jgi:hypothetical protein